MLLVHVSRLKVAVVLCGFLLAFSQTANALSATKFSGATEVLFNVETSTISKSELDKIRAFVQRAEQFQTDVIVVLGHSSKNERHAQSLSEQRALKTVELLIKLGVAPNRIFSEGKGHTQASTGTPLTATDRRVVLEYVGTHPKNSITGGFNFMPMWKEATLPREGLRADIQKDWMPLKFAQQIKETDLKQLFLLKLSLDSLVTNNELVLMAVAGQLSLCGSAKDGLPNPYLYAVLWGSQEAKRALSKCNTAKDTTEEHRIDVFKRVFCGDSTPQANSGYDSLRDALFASKSWVGNLSGVLASELFACSLSLGRVKWLLDQGIKLPSKVIENQPVLFTAVERGDIELTRLLLEAGADVSSRFSGGDTILHRVSRGQTPVPYAVTYALPLDKQKELWNLLLKKGADPEATNDRGEKPKAP